MTCGLSKPRKWAALNEASARMLLSMPLPLYCIDIQYRGNASARKPTYLGAISALWIYFLADGIGNVTLALLGRSYAALPFLLKPVF